MRPFDDYSTKCGRTCPPLVRCMPFCALGLNDPGRSSTIGQLSSGGVWTERDLMRCIDLPAKGRYALLDRACRTRTRANLTSGNDIWTLRGSCAKGCGATLGMASEFVLNPRHGKIEPDGRGGWPRDPA